MSSVQTPGSVSEIQAAVRSAAGAGRPLIPAGRQRWLQGGGWLERDGMILATTGLDSICEYEPADLTITADAGIGVDDLAAAVATNGQWLPLDTPGSQGGTLGAAVATGGFGPLRECYGATRDNVLGVEVVTGRGELLRLGGRVVKNVAGYDLVRLLVGSRGSLGILTRVSLRLFPRPDADWTLVFVLNAERALAMAGALRRSHLPVAAMLLEGRGLRNVGDGHAVRLVVRLLGAPREVDEILGRVVAAAGTDPDRVLHDGESRHMHDRHRAWEDDAGLVVRLRALPGVLDRSVAVARGVAAAMAGQIEIVADAGSGVVRVRGEAEGAEMAAVEVALAAARKSIEALGGSLTLSAAPAELGRRVGWESQDEGIRRITRRIRSLFDPHRVFAPGCPE